LFGKLIGDNKQTSLPYFSSIANTGVFESLGFTLKIQGLVLVFQCMFYLFTLKN